MARRPQHTVQHDLLTSQEVWEITHQTLSEHVRLDVSGDVYEKGDILDVLLQAASTAGTIESACEALEDIGTGNGIRYHLNTVSLAELETDLNASLLAHAPHRLFQTARKVAVDLVLVPYYGTVEPDDDDFLIRSQPRAGTTHFFGYATLCLLHRHQRYTVALRCLRKSEPLLELLKWLLTRLTTLGGQIKRLFLDAGFYSVAICRYLLQADVPFVMPVPKKGKTGGIRKLFVGSHTYTTIYTMRSPHDGTLEVPVIVVRKYSQGKYHRHGVEWLAYIAPRWTGPLPTVHEVYRGRFGIESSYALMHAVRARTRSRKPAVRLLAVGVALVLVNLWVFLKWSAVSLPRKGGRLVLDHLFPFETMALFLQLALLQRHGSHHTIYLRQAQGGGL